MQKKTETITASPSRRKFLGLLWAGLGLAALAEGLAAVLAFLKPKPPVTGPDDGATLVIAGPVASFKPETVTAFPRGRFYLARLSDGGFLAMSRKCTHLGCTVPWMAEEKQFICPCHGSIFDITGAVVESPAPRALDLFKVHIENNVVKVDITKPFKRSAFEKLQVRYGEKKG